jgi:hypothetical protein
MALRTASWGGSARSPAEAQHRTRTEEGRSRWALTRAQGARREGAEAGRRWSAMARQHAIASYRVTLAGSRADHRDWMEQIFPPRPPLGSGSRVEGARGRSPLLCFLRGHGPPQLVWLSLVGKNPYYLLNFVIVSFSWLNYKSDCWCTSNYSNY